MPLLSPQAEKTANKAALADRLITGLAGEYQRWTASILTMTAAEGKLVGDVLLAAAFVSYAGPFNALLRKELVEEKWLPDIRERGIPISDQIAPLDLLTDDSTKAWGCPLLLPLVAAPQLPLPQPLLLVPLVLLLPPPVLLARLLPPNRCRRPIGPHDSFCQGPHSPHPPPLHAT